VHDHRRRESTSSRIRHAVIGAGRDLGDPSLFHRLALVPLLAGGLFVCYLLWQVVPVPGKTLNAIIAGQVFAGWGPGGTLALVTILSEGALLMVAAQTGFIDGPRVMANMATFVFVSVAVVDSGSFKGAAEMKALRDSVRGDLGRYVDLARTLGFAADCRSATGTDVVETAVSLCRSIAREFPDSTFFAGQIVFRSESVFHRLLHNETAFAIRRNLQFAGITTVILPVQTE